MTTQHLLQRSGGPNYLPMSEAASSDLNPTTMPGYVEPSWQPRRKQACSLCRQRKRKCDAQLPSCSSCFHNKIRCIYVTTALDGSVGYQRTQGGNPQVVGQRDFLPTTASTSSIAWLFPASVEDSNNNSNSLDLSDTFTWDMGLRNAFFSPQQLSSPSSLHNMALVPQTEMEGVQNSSRMRGRSNSSSRGPSTARSDYSIVGGPSIGTPLTEHSGILFEQPKSQVSPIDSSSGTGRDPRSFPHGELASAAEEHGTTNDISVTLDGDLPPPQQIMEILDIFFTRHHFLLACIHQHRYLERITRDRFSAQASPLIWILIAVAAPAHPDPRVQALQYSSLDRAKSIFDGDIHKIACPTQTLQAAVWIVFKAYVSADLAEAWFFLGKACRLASLLGWDRIDCSQSARMVSLVPAPRDAIETEERRKTIWALFFLDRSLSCLTGFPLAIDERLFTVNFAVDEDVFQSPEFNIKYSQIMPVPFAMDLSTLVNASVMQDMSTKAQTTHIIQGAILLGRITTLHNHQHMSRDRPEYRAEFSNIENILSLFCFALSRGVGTLGDLHAGELFRTVWLHVLGQLCNILLYHPTVSDKVAKVAPQQGGSDASPGFVHCFDAVRKALRVIKEIANRSVDALVNPFLLPAYFLCCRFLLISWHEHKNQTYRDEIDLILRLVDLIGERWAPLAKKFRGSIMRDLSKDAEEIRSMRVGIGNYMAVECC